MNTAEIGKKGERIAAKFLKQNGYTILETNRHESHNELDIIAANREYIIFVEVKTRTVEGEDCYLPFGSPAAAVDRPKQKRTLQAARQYLRQHVVQNKQPRMDVIEVFLDKKKGTVVKLNHIEDAFGA